MCGCTYIHTHTHIIYIHKYAKPCQNVVNGKGFMFSLVSTHQGPGMFLSSIYSCTWDHVSTPSCKQHLGFWWISFLKCLSPTAWNQCIQKEEAWRLLEKDRWSPEKSKGRVVSGVSESQLAEASTDYVSIRRQGPSSRLIAKWKLRNTTHPFNRVRGFQTVPNPSSSTKCLVQIIFLLDKKYTRIHDLKIPSLNGGILANKIMLPASFERLSITLGF